MGLPTISASARWCWTLSFSTPNHLAYRAQISIFRTVNDRAIRYLGLGESNKKIFFGQILTFYIHQKFGRNYFPPPIFLKIVWNVVLLNVIPSNQVELDRIKIEIIMLILLPGLTTTFPPRKPPKQNIEYIISQKRNPPGRMWKPG